MEKLSEMKPWIQKVTLQQSLFGKFSTGEDETISAGAEPEIKFGELAEYSIRVQA